ncbi:MAG: HipA domain-containing protein [Proteobacteria bacterium]|nr:HipA domain-containing protein [Pseudomonadota bacterium]
MAEQALAIYLDEMLVGTLHGDSNDRHEFRLDRAYRERYPRPILGQVFEDDPDRIHKSSIQLPPWFSNLLPEGALREMVARQVGVKEIREFYLLARVGCDLAGAVRAVPLGELKQQATISTVAEGDDPEVRFSLAGLQLKLSMIRDGQRWILPVRDQSGHWLVKLPDPSFPRVPENEYSMLSWSAAVGIETPDHELVEMTHIDVPKGVQRSERLALAVRRFDRQPDGTRVHQEDFAQVFGLYSHKKYDRYNYESIASVLLRTAGREALDSFIDRLVFVIASGNGDAHHKNWSLRYPDGMIASLSPTYDQVATVLYPGLDHSLALNLGGSKRFEDIRMRAFTRLAKRLDLDPTAMEAKVRDAVTRICDAWNTVADDTPLTSGDRDAVERHWRRVPLLSQPVSSFVRSA